MNWVNKAISPPNVFLNTILCSSVCWGRDGVREGAGGMFAWISFDAPWVGRSRKFTFAIPRHPCRDTEDTLPRVLVRRKFLLAMDVAVVCRTENKSRNILPIRPNYFILLTQMIPKVQQMSLVDCNFYWYANHGVFGVCWNINDFLLFIKNICCIMVR